MALIVAGERSGVGKTTITLAILSYLTTHGEQLQSFKVGPDYIDPMFHSRITGRACRNLDPVLTSENYVKQSFQRHTQNVHWSLIEGVMGLFDGVNHSQDSSSLADYGSTAHVARILNLPVALVLDSSHLSTSVAAIAHGYLNLDKRINIAGVILNQVGSDRHLLLLEQALKQLQIPILGVFRRQKTITIPDRHLGLVPTAEVANIDHLIQELTSLAQNALDWTALKPLIRQKSSSLLAQRSSVQQSTQISQSDTIKEQPIIRIAIAYDKAFNFYYQDNLDILEALGAELIYWSPLKDTQIPESIQGLYFGGGFPEIFASELAQNFLVLKQLKQIIEHGVPTYAECGGLMYLCQQLIDFEDFTWPMVGAIPNQVKMSTKLSLGYRRAIALSSGPLTIQQQQTIGHEFHRSHLITSSPQPQWQLVGLNKNSASFTEGWQQGNIHASYLHLHWGANHLLPQRFIEYCRNF